MKSKFLAFILVLLEIMGVVGLIQPAMGCAQQASLQANPQSPAVLQAEFNVPFQLRPNQAAQVNAEPIQITFITISEDSRCPLEVSCIRAGQATATFKLQGQANQENTFELTLAAAQSDLAVHQLDGYSIQLMKVDPYPKTTQTIKPLDYKVTVVISKN